MTNSNYTGTKRGPNVPIRWFMDCDDDGHTYLIPEAKRGLWQKWCDIPWTSDKSAPEWARQVDNPSDISFIL